MIDSYCIIKICFDNIEDVRRCVSSMTKENLFAYAHVSRIGSYKLRLENNDSDNIVGYFSDENVLGYPSEDKQDDILLEIYTSVRLGGKIKMMIEKEFPSNIDSYLTIPILEASREMRNLIQKLNLHHMKEDRMI